MNSNQLKHFVAVAKSENITKSANTLFVSQPAITKSIQNLEDELGVLLFDRDGKKIVLNASGKIALEYACSILANIDAMKNALSSVSGTSRKLSLCTNLPLINRYLIPAFLLNHPTYTITAQLFEQANIRPELLIDRTFDIVISAQPIHCDDVINQPFFNDSLVLNVPPAHALARREAVVLDDLEGLSILMPLPGKNNYHGHLLDSLLKQRNIHYNAISVLDTGTLDYFSEITDCCSITSEFSNRFTELKSRVSIPILASELQIPYYFSFMSGNEQHIMPFLDWLLHDLSADSVSSVL